MLLIITTIKRVLSHLCYNAIFGRSGSNPYEHNYGDRLEAFDPSRLAFHGHSRSLEPIGYLFHITVPQ